MAKPATTPVRAGLEPASSLHKQVCDGLGALEASHRSLIESAIRSGFRDSIDIDAALKAGREHENRWDYLLGHGPSGKIVALEPHSAKDDEVGTVIRKRRAALDQLRTHLKSGSRPSKWLWVASGNVYFANTEKTRLRLDQEGIEFIGKCLLAKHLPRGSSPPRLKTPPTTSRK